MKCIICNEEKDEWDLFKYQCGNNYCKIHSKGYRESHKKT